MVKIVRVNGSVDLPCQDDLPSQVKIAEWCEKGIPISFQNKVQKSLGNILNWHLNDNWWICYLNRMDQKIVNLQTEIKTLIMLLLELCPDTESQSSIHGAYTFLVKQRDAIDWSTDVLTINDGKITHHRHSFPDNTLTTKIYQIALDSDYNLVSFQSADRQDNRH